MKYLVLASLLILGGCTVKVEDTRLTREEVQRAFQERDAILVGITKQIELLKAEKQGKK